MRDLPEAMRLNRLHQRRKHIPAIPRRLLQIPEPVTIMRLDLDHLIGIRHMPKRVREHFPNAASSSGAFQTEMFSDPFLAQRAMAIASPSAGCQAIRATRDPDSEIVPDTFFAH